MMKRGQVVDGIATLSTVAKDGAMETAAACIALTMTCNRGSQGRSGEC